MNTKYNVYIVQCSIVQCYICSNVYKVQPWNVHSIYAGICTLGKRVKLLEVEQMVTSYQENR